MRILIISDSHGYGLAGALVRLDSEIQVRTVSVSSTMDRVWLQYQEELSDLQAFRPEYVCMHMGHNDVVWHAHHNTQPKHPMVVQSLVMGYQGQVQRDFPGSQVWVSCLFPRIIGPKMDQRRMADYNRMVYQYGSDMRETFPPRGIKYFLNSSLWFSPGQGRVHGVFLRSDGLHLSHVGSDAVAKQWLEKMLR
jgi:lysophospholipase L1-like esterase